MTRPTETPDRPFPMIPRHLQQRMREAVQRPWLETALDEALANAQTVVLTGEPGWGKSVFAAHLAATRGYLCWFVRPDGHDGIASADPQACLTSLGLQLFTRFGPLAFHDPALTIRVQVGLGRVAPGATADGVYIGQLVLSPFQQLCLESSITVDEHNGNLRAIHIGQLLSRTDGTNLRQLAREALVEPLWRLHVASPETLVHLVVDGLDESAEIADALPRHPELPPNVRWILLSQPGEHLDRFLATEGTACINLADGHLRWHSVNDAERYVLSRLSPPPLAKRLAAGPPVRPVPQLARDLAEASAGNLLYLHHIMDEIMEETAEGRYELLMAPGSALPKGLDAIYRLMMQKLTGKLSPDDWDQLAAPILGVLAVARAPLSSCRIAEFTRISRLKVDRFLLKASRFLEDQDLDSDAGYLLYHASFAAYLLTQDHRRNPCPLLPNGHYHAQITRFYAQQQGAEWEPDAYALDHLPMHLLHAGQIDALCDLLTGSFGERQLRATGPARARAQLLASATAAAEHGTDLAFLRLLQQLQHLDEQLDTLWENGSLIHQLADQDAAALYALALQWLGSDAGESAGHLIPWAPFLIAERLLDVDEAGRALALVDLILRHHLPAREAHPAGQDLPGFLAKVARHDASRALALAEALGESDPDDASSTTDGLWQKTLAAFLAAPAQPAQQKALADVTYQRYKQRLEQGKAAALPQELLTLAVLAVPQSQNLPEWYPSALRTVFREKLEADYPEQLWIAMADALLFLQGLRDALPPSQRHSVQELMDLLVAQCPVPDQPTQFHYGMRMEAMARVASAVFHMGSAHWHVWAERALAAAELDVTSNDPYWASLAVGVALLRELPLPQLQEPLNHLCCVNSQVRARQVPTTHSSEEISSDHPNTNWPATASVYNRYRLALTLCHSGEATPQTIAALWAQHRRSDAPGPAARFMDLVLEGALLTAGVSPEEWAPELVVRLEQARRPQRRMEVTFPPTPHPRWSSLQRCGKIAQLRSELRQAFETAADAGDLERQVDCCLKAVTFDPDLANTWLGALQTRIAVADYAWLLVLMVEELERCQPGRLPHLGKAWADAYAQLPESARVPCDEICFRWGSLSAHQSHVLASLQHILESLSDELCTRLTEALQSNPFGLGEAEREAWHWLGTLLRKVGYVQPAALQDAVAEIQLEAACVWSAATKALPRWQRDVTIAAMLKGAAEYDSLTPLPDGPMANALISLYNALADSAVPAEGVSGVGPVYALQQHQKSRKERVVTGVALAGLLKSSRPDWSAARFHDGVDAWTALLAGEDALPFGLVPQADAIDDLLATLSGREDGRRGRLRALIELTHHLIAWSLADPVTPEHIALLEQHATRSPHPGIRSRVLAELSCGWLEAHRFREAACTADLARTADLLAADVADSLRSVTLPCVVHLDEADRKALRHLLLRVLTAGQASEEQTTYTLQAWFSLRAAEESADWLKETAGKLMGV